MAVVRDVAASMKKETVLCKKDSPGFIVNRILVPALNEAALLVDEGVADPEDIDKAITLGLNWPMGPLKLLDYVGLDTALNISEVFMDEFQDSQVSAVAAHQADGQGGDAREEVRQGILRMGLRLQH